MSCHGILCPYPTLPALPCRLSRRSGRSNFLGRSRMKNLQAYVDTSAFFSRRPSADLPLSPLPSFPPCSRFLSPNSLADPNSSRRALSGQLGVGPLQPTTTRTQRTVLQSPVSQPRRGGAYPQRDPRRAPHQGKRPQAARGRLGEGTHIMLRYCDHARARPSAIV